ncbi:MAG: NAD(P)-binding domain-containing protein [Roseiarcus sp.]
MMVRVAVIGAGPNGLSIAAHLNARGLQPLVFGRPMEFWRSSIPRSMKLKSDGYASNLSEPSGRHTLKAYCEAQGRPYADTNPPIPLETYIAFSEAFQRKFVPQVDTRFVETISLEREGFALRLDDGAAIEADEVVVATGAGAFANIPAPLAHVSPARMSHSSRISDCARFAGKRVLVVGAGASAIDVAASMVVAGAEVRLVCRERALSVSDGGGTGALWRKLGTPDTPFGVAWRRRLAATLQNLFSLLPDWLRVDVVDNTLGPAPVWFIGPEIEGRIRVLPGREVLGAAEDVDEDEVELELGRVGAQIERVRADHIVLATGYRVELARLSLLSPELLSKIDLIEGSPRLSATFESSVSRLYFAGAMAAYTFGPPLRFVYGADFAAKRIAAAIEARSRTHRETTTSAPPVIRLAPR